MGKQPAVALSDRYIRVVLAFVLTVSAVLVGAVRSEAAADVISQKLKVVVSAYPLFEAVARVGGGRVHVSNLLPLDPFRSLTESEKLAVKNASLFVAFPKGFQPHIDEALASRVGPTLVVSDDLVSRTDQFVGSTTDSSARVDTATTVGSSYFWEVPSTMFDVAEQVRAALSALDPGGAYKFKKASVAYGEMLAGVDRNFAHTLATCKRSEIVTADDRFNALFARYGIKQRVVATRVDGSVDLASMSTAVSEVHPYVVLFRSLPDLPEAKRLLKTYDVRVSALDPVLTQPDQARRGGANYGTVMAVNLDALRVVLGCSQKTSAGQ